MNKSHTDIRSQVWFDAILPVAAKPYMRLARFDRPIGAWLLFIPGLWSIWLAAGIDGADGEAVSIGRAITITLLFLIGAIVMRGAGCVVNDLWDQDLDIKVTRTAGRPLPSGDVSRRGAFVMLAGLMLVGLIIVLLMPPITLALAVLSLLFVAAYPLAKRVIDWPQAVLGLTFNFGALMGASAILGHVPLFAIVLYIGSFFWTIGYDTIYAHQDREDDMAVGVKSTALLFGERTKPIIRLFYALAVIFWAISVSLAGAGFWAWGGLLAAALTLSWQVRVLDINSPAKCLMLFKFSAWTGWVFGLGIILAVFLT